MTKDEIEKGCKLCASASDYSNCNDCPAYANCVSAAAYNLVIEQEKEINQLKTECTLLDDELRNARQDTIDVLNKLKSKCHNYYPSIDHYCCSVKAVNLSDIDELIKEVLNAKDKS